jgi:CheY-like chemotaxis protein
MVATVLVVDDSPANLNVLSQLLARDAYTIRVAGSGADALEVARAQADQLDLILLDVALGDTDGITVCKSLKGDPRTRAIPVVLISGVQTDDESISRGLDAGAEGYLVKPITDNALRAWVRATLRISQLQRELTDQNAGRAITETELLRVFSSLSHAVNNPLQALYAAADTLALELPAESQEQALVGEIITQAEHVAQIVAGASLRARGQAAP